MILEVLMLKTPIVFFSTKGNCTTLWENRATTRNDSRMYPLLVTAYFLVNVEMWMGGFVFDILSSGIDDPLSPLCFNREK